MEVKFYPVDELELSGTWTHVEAGYDNFQFPAVGDLPAQNLSGNAPAQIPKDSLTLGMNYKWPLASNMGKLDSTISSYYRSEITFQDVANGGGGLPPNGNIGPAYWVSSFSTNWRGIMGSNFDASFWVKNLFDKYYITYSNTQASLGYTQIARGDPRMFGAHLRYNF